jgi:hypothetical protein
MCRRVCSAFLSPAYVADEPIRLSDRSASLRTKIMEQFQFYKSSQFCSDWRVTADEDGHYCFAVTMGRPTMRSGPITCDAPRSCATLTRNGCPE